jgi:hypothetical protein
MSVAMARSSTNPTRKRRYNTIVRGRGAAQLIINRSDYSDDLVASRNIAPMVRSLANPGRIALELTKWSQASSPSRKGRKACPFRTRYVSRWQGFSSGAGPGATGVQAPGTFVIYFFAKRP